MIYGLHPLASTATSYVLLASRVDCKRLREKDEGESQEGRETGRGKRVQGARSRREKEGIWIRTSTVDGKKKIGNGDQAMGGSDKGKWTIKSTGKIRGERGKSYGKIGRAKETPEKWVKQRGVFARGKCA